MQASQWGWKADNCSTATVCNRDAGTKGSLHFCVPKYVRDVRPGVGAVENEIS